MKRTIPVLICFAVGLLLLVHKLFPVLSDLNQIANRFFILLAAVAFVLGAGSFLRSHWDKVRRRHAGWAYSAVAILAFAITFILGVLKVGVTPLPGFSALLGDVRGVVALAEMQIKDGERALALTLRGAPPESEYPVTLSGPELGTVTLGTLRTNAEGRADLLLRALEPRGADSAAGAADAPGVGEQAELLRLARGTVYTLAIGELLSGALTAYPWYTGQPDADGGVLWFIYEYAFKPLQQMMFALLAFYVASAAFRAFRARNVESVLLLGTAFVILLGRTAVGVAMTDWAPREGPFSLLYVPNLTEWIMNFWATAGNRAIMIGIALGIVSTSLKVLLGIERNYLGADK